MLFASKSRRVARAAEGAPLLREYRVKSLIEGSNPSLSATSEKTLIFRVFLCLRFALVSTGKTISGREFRAGNKKTSEVALLALLFLMVRPERFELPTAWFVARYSIQLSYGRIRSGILHELN